MLLLSWNRPAVLHWVQTDCPVHSVHPAIHLSQVAHVVPLRRYPVVHFVQAEVELHSAHPCNSPEQLLHCPPLSTYPVLHLHPGEVATKLFAVSHEVQSRFDEHSKQPTLEIKALTYHQGTACCAGGRVHAVTGGTGEAVRDRIAGLAIGQGCRAESANLPK